jgi:hypothetical protein
MWGPRTYQDNNSLGDSLPTTSDYGCCAYQNAIYTYVLQDSLNPSSHDPVNLIAPVGFRTDDMTDTTAGPARMRKARRSPELLGDIGGAAKKNGLRRRAAIGHCSICIVSDDDSSMRRAAHGTKSRRSTIDGPEMSKRRPLSHRPKAKKTLCYLRSTHDSSLLRPSPHERKPFASLS